MHTHRRILIPIALFTLMTGCLPAQSVRSRPDRNRNGGEETTRRERGQRPERPGSVEAAAVFPLEFRTLDGRGNQLRLPELGAAETAFRRLFPAAYEDGVDLARITGLPSARAVSNALHAQDELVPNALGASDFVWQWGQFVDHDVTETGIAEPREELDITVPLGDAWFDPFGSGVQRIALDRSAYEVIDGVREQVNLITAFIDASNVYGSETERAQALRTLDGTGRLLTSAGRLLPFNVAGLHNAPSSDPSFYLAGDLRANEQVGLIAMHTLFVREHNWWVDQLAVAMPNLSGEQLYLLARAIVGAEMQAITYREFLPLLLGSNTLRPYRGYRANVDPSISNVFATAAYRVGHTMLSPQILRLEANGAPSAGGPLPLADAFFSPSTFEASGIEAILRGLAAQRAQAVDAFVVDDLRNFLFGPPGAGGFDLASLNIQRGRDHGLPGYARIRRGIGGERIRNFRDLGFDVETTRALAQLYPDVDAVDAWTGLLLEPPAEGAMVGGSLAVLLAEQFERLRDGDRFWYEAYLPAELVAMVDAQRLSVIIRRNTGIGAELPGDVFRVR